MSMSFPSAELAVLSDGCGSLSLYSRQTQWVVVWTQRITDGIPFFIASSGVQADKRTVDCLLVSLREGQREDNRSATLGRVSWISLQMTSDSDGYDVIKRCVFETTNWPEVLTFDSNCSAMYMLCDGSVTVVQSETEEMDCQNPSTLDIQDGKGSVLQEKVQFVRSEEDSCGTSNEHSASKRVRESDTERSHNRESETRQYRWSQTDEDVIVSFDIPSGITKKDIICRIEMSELTVSLSDGTCLIRGELFGDIDPEGSCWTMDKDKAEVSLEKKQTGRFWPSLLAYKGVRQVDSRGINQLEKDTTDTPGGQSDDTNVSQGLNEMMEECDVPFDDSVAVYRFDSSGVATHKANLGGHQWLFNVSIQPNSPQATCLRHDVDGLLWQLGGKNPIVKDKFPTNHVATFHALGYVQASKRLKKFTSCSSDASYAVITDCNRHVYIYRQPEGPVPGAAIGRSADQHVITLPRDKSDDILGMVAFSGLVHVLTRDVLYIVSF